MNHEQYIQRMAELGYSRQGAEGLIKLPKDRASWALRTFNFVPAGDGLYEIWLSDERDDFFRVGAAGNKFLGTLGDAYNYVFEDRRKRQEERLRRHQPD